jgi:hypothetical protein
LNPNPANEGPAAIKRKFLGETKVSVLWNELGDGRLLLL